MESSTNQSQNAYQLTATSCNDVQDAYQPTATNSNNMENVHQPPPASSQVHEQITIPTSHTDDHQSLSTTNHLQEQLKPSSTIAYQSQDACLDTAGSVLSTNTVVINVLGHPPSQSSDMEINNPGMNGCYVKTASMGLSNHAAHVNADGNIHAKHHASYMYDAVNDPSLSKKGIKRSRPC
jgi:hypothetical protein